MNESLHRLPLVGRQDEMKTILENFHSLDRPVVLYIEGEGGIGKTALLEAALEEMRKQKRGIVASSIIDIYHLDYQLPRGFALGVIEALDAADAFEKYKALADDLDAKVQRGEEQPQEAMHQVWTQFVKDLSALAQERGPLVIAVDTVEVLDYLRDWFQEEAGLSPDLCPELFGLFIDHLRELQGPILWLMAGRPSAVRERFEEEGLLSEGKVITLGPLGKEEAFEYIERLMLQMGEEAKARLKRATQTYGESFYRETKGRPILLAMAADIVASGGALPDAFYQEDALEQDTQDALEERLLRKLLETEGIGTTLRKMAMLRKGANAKLLAMLEGDEEWEAQRRLERIAQLVLVKKRPEGERPYFLHDEIYAMFDRHPEYLPAEEDRRRYWEQIQRYYEEEEKRLWPSFEQVIKADERNRLKTLLSGLRAEYLHYLMWQEPHKGFAYYFIHAEDALDARERERFLLLRGELMRTLRDLRNFHRIQPQVEQWIQEDAAVRWGIYYHMVESNDEAAGKLIERARKWMEGKPGKPALWNMYHLQLYEEVLRLRQGKVKETQEALDHLAEALAAFHNEDEMEKQILDVLRAYIANYQGYADRLQGRYHRAIRHYQYAAAGFRRFKVSTLTTTLSNQAYVMSLVGWERRARQAIVEAEQLARYNPYHHAMVLNVGCIVESQGGHLNTAITYADQALNILHQQQIRFPFLEALLYTNRARAYRYTWNRQVELRCQSGCQDIEEGNSISKAREDIDKALEISESENLSKDTYLIERWGEAGAIYRELERPNNAYKHEKEGGDALRRVSAEHYFLAAAGVMERPDEPLPTFSEVDIMKWETAVRQLVEEYLGGDPYWATVALVNLGWHWLYQSRPYEWLKAIYDLVHKIVPLVYHLPKPSMERKKEEANILLWSVLGKVEMLLFHAALWNWDNLSSEERDRVLEENTWHVVYALEYNHLTGESPYDLRRAEEGLNKRIMSIRDWERCLLPRLYRYGEEAVKQLQEEGFSKLEREEATFIQWLEERFGPKDLWIG